MAKGQKRSTREVKKPKGGKKADATAASTPFAPPPRPAPTKGGAK